MPKSKSHKFYGTRIGRDGPHIYRTWQECEKAVKGFPGARYRSFASEEAALQWAFELEVEDLVQKEYKEGDVIYISSDDEDEVLSVSSGDAHSEARGYIKPSYEENIANNARETAAKLSSTERVVLSEQQKYVLRKVLQGESVFFTGSAGTGKSVLLREIIKQLRSSNKSVAVTASTGIAATNIGGSTLHFFAGIGLGKESTDKLFFRISKGNNEVLERWRNTEVLVIDEVSMIDGLLFDKLEELSRRLRRNSKSFGGIQLVLCGDFCQLPPVPERQNDSLLPVTFAFDSKSWNKCVGKPIVLTTIFRQKQQKFIDILNALRLGKVDPQAEIELRALERPIESSDGIEPTELYPMRFQVQDANANRMKCLPEPTWIYTAHDIPGEDENGVPISFTTAQKLLVRIIAPKQLSLKIGAQVMLLKNMTQYGLVNGSRGVVFEFMTLEDAKRQAMTVQSETYSSPSVYSEDHEGKRKWPFVKFTNGRTLLCSPSEFSVSNHAGVTEARRIQVPLVLAWALSIHKSQGQTIERLKVDLGRTFEKGQAYVALSRATSMDALQVLNFDVHKVMAHPRVIEWQASASQHSTQREVIVLSDDELDIDDEDVIKAYYDSLEPCV